MATPGLADELLAKHKTSTQPSSKVLCAVLAATLEVIQSEGYEPSSSALFAATMSSLDKPEGQSSPEVATALCTVLSASLSRIPVALIRSKFTTCTKIVMAVIEKQQEQAGVVRVAVEALGQLTAAMDVSDWPAAAGPFNKVLGLCVDARPKVRRAAHTAISSTLTAIQNSPASAPASEAVLKVCLQVLPGPEVALRAAKSAGSKKRQEAGAMVQRAVTDVNHLLNMLRICLPMLSGPVVSQLAEALPKLYHLQQPAISSQATDTLAALYNSNSAALSVKAAAKLLSTVLAAEFAWETRNAHTLLSLMQLVKTGLLRLQKLDLEAAAERLGQAFSKIMPCLLANQEDVRQAAKSVLKSLVVECVHPVASKGDVSSFGNVFECLESSLSATYQEAWPSVLSVLADLMAGLRAVHLEHVNDILDRLGDMATDAAAAMAESEGDSNAEALSKAIDAVLGAAICSMGPEKVLGVLPLNLQGEDGGDPRTWLLPLLRHHVQNASLDFWGAKLLPAARIMCQRASVTGSDGAQRFAALQYRALEAQIWGTLPSFCIWPVDMAEAFRKHAQDLGKAFQNREDLRPQICSALERLCTQNKAALQAAGITEGLGYAKAVQEGIEDGDSEEEESLELVVPEHYTAAVAQENANVLRQFAKNWMPLLFNAFAATPAGQRSYLGRAISAYAALTEPTMLNAFFTAVIKKLVKVVRDSKGSVPAPDAIKEGGTTSTEQRCTFMELALCLASGLDDSAIKVLYKAATPCLQEKDQALQKRAYKLLAYIIEQRQEFAQDNFQEILDSLLLGVATSMSAAKRYRLRCLKAAILILQQENAPEIAAADAEMELLDQKARQKQVVAMLVAEIVLCIKEVNKRTRIAAYELLVSLANAMQEAFPPKPICSPGGKVREEEKGGLHTLFTMVLGCLVGSTPHMISASVMALARLMHQFVSHLEATAPQLLPIVLSLLRSKCREVVKAVLGFVKVCVMKLPAEMLQLHLKAILDGILVWSGNSKDKFRLKVRGIMDRLLKRLNYETVAENMPAGDSKLLSHIRKERQRKHRSKMQSDAGSQMDIDEDMNARARSQSGKTAQTRSEWAHSRIFTDGDREGAPTLRSGSRVTSQWGEQHGKKAKSRAPSSKGGSRQLRQLADRDGEEPLDLLDISTSRAMLRSAAGRGGVEDDGPDFEMQGGRMVINEEAAPQQAKPKRKRGGGIDLADSDDSDFEDLRQISGATAALRISGDGAKSTAGQSGGRSLSGRTLGGRTTGKSSAGRTFGARSSRAENKGKEHTGARFAAKKGGARGDMQGKSKVEPYAYWPLDRKMLNRRNSKKAQASKGLSSIVKAAQVGAAKGRKAKRQRRE